MRPGALPLCLGGRGASVREPDEAILREQVDYYRARADEYDGWFFRTGRYDRGEQATQQWFNEIEQVREALSGVPLDGGDVLELAPGTGLWTELLCRRARSVTAVDASSEMVAQARRRLGEAARKVQFVKADLFTWEPTSRFDAVVFCFWISHVPESRLDDFIGKVHRALRPAGSVFFVDARKEPTSTAGDHELPGENEELMRRRLDDGQEFTIVKNFWPANDLAARFASAGIDIEVCETPTYFQYGIGRRTG